MKQVAIVYYSGYGHTERQAQAVLSGVCAESLSATLIAIDQQGNIAETAWQGLDEADAIIFGSPTYMGNAPWQFKKFADDSSKRWFQNVWQDKLAAGFVNSASINGDKSSTLAWLCTFAMQHRMIWVGLATPSANTLSADRNDPNWLGGFMGALAQSPADSSPDQGPLPGDLDTAKQLGQRVATLLKKS